MTIERSRGLVISDVDSTFLTQEVIELVADYAGVRDEVEAVTTAAMRGELDFAASLEHRVALLAGTAQDVLAKVQSALTLRQGARELVAAAHTRGWRFALVSGGFAEIISPLAQELGIEHVVANSFEVRNGALTGRTRGEIVTGEVKARTAREIQKRFSIPRSRTIALGDGANDIALMHEAGLAIGISPKPALKQVVDYSYEGSLSPVIDQLIALDQA